LIANFLCYKSCSPDWSQRINDCAAGAGAVSSRWRRLFSQKKRREFFGHAAAIQLKYARDNGKKRRAIETLVCFGNEKFIY